MRLLIVLFGVVFIHWVLNNEPKTNIDEMVNKMYLDSLEGAYKFKTKQLRIYMPIAIKNNSLNK